MKAISAFDLDHTLITENSSYRFGCDLCHQKRLPYWDLLYIMGCSFRHSLGLLPIEKLHEGAFRRLFLGKSETLIKDYASEFVDTHFHKMLYPPAVEVLKQAQADGHLTVLMSSGTDFIVGEFARHLNIPLWQATQYAVDKDHRFCHISTLVLGGDKARRLDELRKEYGIAKEQTYAYSDSHLDLPFLQAAGHAIGVNPNRQLRALCRKNQWSII